MSNKKRKENENAVQENEGSCEEMSDDEEEGSNPDIYKGNEEIQVDFEGRNPIDSDFDGIKQLLKQLFLKAHVNLSELTDIIISQNYIGSVIKQCWDEEMDDEEEDDSDDANLSFGVTTAVNLTHRKEAECVQQIKTLLLEKAEKNATDATLTLLRDILGNDGKPTGLLINERFINIPAQISVPMLDSLRHEIRRANDKKMPYNFSYFIMFLKFHRQAAKKQAPAEDIFSNPEEEVFLKESLANFEFSVETEADTGMAGNWLEEDETMTPFRKVVILDAKRLPDLVESITNLINSP